MSEQALPQIPARVRERLANVDIEYHASSALLYSAAMSYRRWQVRLVESPASIESGPRTVGEVNLLVIDLTE